MNRINKSDMIDPVNVVEILSNLIADRLTLNSNTRNTTNDREVAESLFDSVQSIWNSTSYSFENEQTLDIDIDEETNIDQFSSTQDDDPISNMDDVDGNDGNIDDLGDDYHDDQDINNTVKHQFSIEYMRNVLQFYDQFDEVTGRRRHSFANVQRHFKCIKHKNYISRFRIYLKKYGTKGQKLEEIDAFVYGSFKNARQQLLSVHDVDLRKWALKKAAEVFIDDFTASDFWVYQFKKNTALCREKLQN
jgi:hypothetical protein